MHLTNPGWIGPLAELEFYTIFAVGLALIANSDEKLARMAGPSIALVDLPATLFVISAIITGLEAGGTPTEIAMWRVAASTFYVVLVFSALLTLQIEHVWVTAAVAIACQLYLLWPLPGDLTFFFVLPIANLLAVVLVTYASRRTLRLVETVSDEQVRRARMARYFSPHVAETIARSGTENALTQSCVVTVLFCDLRGFTALAETLSEHETVRLLNEFHTRMSTRVFDWEGTLDKLIGDGFMAYFGAPLVQPDHAERAVQCALALHDELELWNAERTDSPLQIGVGLHTGPVILGDIGAPDRQDFTAVGRTVNVAARMENLTKDLGVEIVLSAATRNAVVASAQLPGSGAEGLAFRELGEQGVRGIVDRVHCFTCSRRSEDRAEPEEPAMERSAV